jgi:hypothetical protein
MEVLQSSCGLELRGEGAPLIVEKIGPQWPCDESRGGVVVDLVELKHSCDGVEGEGRPG